MTNLDINSIAIIGSGPGGIASLYELLHTSKDGSSTIGGPKAANPKFTKVVVFEQKDKAGGIWAPSLEKADLPFPPQSLLETESYNNPDIIHPSLPAPEGLEDTSVSQPLVVEGKELSNDLEWSRSGVFPDLFTNVPSRFTRFSYLPNEEKYQDKSRTIYPFLSHQELSKRINDFIEEEKLNDYIRFNSKVESIHKQDNNKWVITVKSKNKEPGREEWYQEEFDGVVIANGHYTVPNIPHVPGLSKFSEKNPGVLIHSKSYRAAEEFRDKKVLVIGGSISTTNLLQYIIPVAKKTVNSKRNPNIVFPWINDALISDGIVAKPRIERFIAETNEVVFSDGSVEKDFDKIIFTTGYHYHYPFLNDYLKISSPSNVSRVSGLYYNTFAIEDPTLATVGVAVSILNFHTIEASAAAIAGVWSGAKSLPSKKEQIEWESKRVEDIGDNLLFHYYPHNVVKKEFVDNLHVYSPFDRYNPLEKDASYLDEIDSGVELSKKLFYKLKDKELAIKNTLIEV